MGIIKDKLNYLEKNLSVKHLARDLIGLQLLLFGSAIIATLLFLWLVNTAVNSSNPDQVVENAQTTTDYMFWFFYIGMNVLIMWFGGKARMEANKTKKEIIDMTDNKDPSKTSEIKE